MSGLVSIIIPVYNLEKYIQFNIDNMLSQTYENLEVIYVDDGSTDSSAQIIKSAAEKDLRIKYYYKENGGVSSARNFGFEKANGEYIMFVDGDDFIHKKAVELYLTSIKNNGTDIAFSPAEEVNSLEYKDEEYVNTADTVFDAGLLTEKKYQMLAVSVCVKMFKKSAIGNERFMSEFKIGEDRIFMAKILAQKVKISFVDAVLYYYYQRDGSAMHKKPESNKFVLASIEKIFEEIDFESCKDIYPYYISELYKFICYERTLIYGISEYKNTLKHYKKIGKKYFSRLLGCKQLGKKRFVYAAFFLSRVLYEKYRLMKDPTMKDFYNQRKQNNNQ